MLQHINSDKMDFRNSLSQILAIMVRNLAMLSFGMGLGFQTILIGGVLQDTQNFVNVGDNEVSWLGSTLWLALVIGCLASGFLTEPLGRKRSMQLVTIPYTACWIAFYYATKVWHLYGILMAMGFFSGVLEGPSITYVSEVSQPHLRGALAISGAIAVTCGTFVQFLLGTFYIWRTCALISCIFPIVTFCIFFLVPESPQWLLSNNKLEEAKQSLAWVRGWTTVESVDLEIKNISQQLIIDNSQVKGSITLNKYLAQFFGRSFLCPLGLISFIFLLSAFTGADTLQTYSIAIFSTMRIPIGEYYATLLLGAVQVLGALINIALLRLLGKRRLAFISLLSLSVCNIAIATYSYLSGAMRITLLMDNEVLSGLDISYQWIPLIFLVLLTLINQCGLYSLPWILMAEVFSYETRAVGSGICSGASSFLSFLSNNLFLLVASQITIPGIYYLHSIIAIIGTAVLYRYLPETEGKTVESIAAHFAEKTNSSEEKHNNPVHSSFTGIENLSFEYGGYYVGLNEDGVSRV